MRTVLGQEFFARPAPEVAPDLLGKFLVRRTGKTEIASMITEAEAYEGMNDKASHASRGRTRRTEVMFDEPGAWYIYLIHGTYWMANIVTGTEGHPSAVLVRSVETTHGPGKLTQYFQIDKSFNEKPAAKETGLWIEDRRLVVKPGRIKKTARIGVNYAGLYWSRRKYRFILED